MPIELELDTPLVGRERELAWLRGTWRQARRGYGRVVFVSGPGQDRKVAAGCRARRFRPLDTGRRSSYAGAGGTAAALAQSSLRDALAARRPALVVLDDFGVTGEAVAPALAELVDAIETASVAGPRPRAGAGCQPRRRPVDRPRGPRGATGTAGWGRSSRRRCARSHDCMPERTSTRCRSSRSRAPRAACPERVHEVMSDWAEQEATRRLAAAAEFLASERRERTADLEFANNVIGLKLARLYGAMKTRRVEADARTSAPTRVWPRSSRRTPGSSSVANASSANWRRGRLAPACSESWAHPVAASHR